MNKPESVQWSIVDQVIRSRKTEKYVGDPLSPVEISSANQATADGAIQGALEAAGWAPFHFARQPGSGVSEPWRVHWLSPARCRDLARSLPTWCDDWKPNNIFPGMLATCSALLLINWLPQTAEEIPGEEKRREVNEEHAAATAAFTQNVLVALTAQGLASYWSSGNVVKEEKVWSRLGLSPSELLMAALFVFDPAVLPASLSPVPGKLRNQRHPWTAWTRRWE